ncbi:Uncharacterised protein [Salmonella sp. NCTC 11881]|nr:Uncharacterised protein [Salmonella sp. NCTC 11881]
MRSFGQLWPTLKTVAGVWLAMAKTALCRGDDAVDCGGGGG